jgi:hypothetical protein
MRKPEFIAYKGKEIVYLDFSDLREKEEIFSLESKGAIHIRSQPKNSAYTLTNVEGMIPFDNEIRDFFQDVIKGNGPYVKASAIFGLNALNSIVYTTLLRMTGRNIRSFKTKKEALEYLAKK